MTITQGMTGTGGFTKLGAGVLTLGGANAYAGATAVSNGTLTVSNDNGTVPGTSGGTSGVTVSTGGTLLLSDSAAVSDRVNNTATVTLAGGTFNLGGLSEGAAGTSGVGALTLSVTSTLDFGTTGGSNLIQFAGLGTHAASTTLTITDYDGASTDHLYFAGTASSFTGLYSQSDVSFNGASGYMTIQGSGYYEVVPVPEASTWISGLLTLGLGGAAGRRAKRVRTA